MSDENTPSSRPSASGYRFVRLLLRLWFGLFFPKIRLLGVDDVPDSGPVLLAINHPAGFLDALILIAAFERQLDCLVDGRTLRGPLRWRLGRWLGMIEDRASDGDGETATVEAAVRCLAASRTVVTFAQPSPHKTATLALADRAATLALEAESRRTGESTVAVFLVHLLLPVAPSESTELLIYVDSPLWAEDYLDHENEPMPRRARVLAEALDRTGRENAFRMHPQEFARLLRDVEDLLRAGLEAEWTSRSEWKQSARDFRLSRFVEDSAEQLNVLNPGRLVALRESLDHYQETRRRWSERQLEAELAGAWLKSPWRRLVGWAESVAGLPVAAWGLINQIGVGAVLAATGFLWPKPGRSVASLWAARGAVALACYAVQVAVVGHYFSRAAAGTYAASLPFSAIYLWRYAWLLRHRTGMLYHAAFLPVTARRLTHLRSQLIEQLDAMRDGYSKIAARAPEPSA